MNLRLKQNAGKLAAVLGLLGLWNLAHALLPAQWHFITTILGLPLALFLPGLFIVLSLGAKRLTAPAFIFSVGLSVLTLIFIGLGANFLPQLFGHSRPLDTPVLQWLFNFVFVGLAAMAAYLYSPDPPPVREQTTPRSPGLNRPWLNLALKVAAAIVPITAVLGAVSLNNDGSNALSLIALILIGAVVPATFLLRRQLTDATLLWTIATTTIALLLSTSLRGWYITGQDLQHEFQVFNLAQQLGRWDINFYRESYNACLSITLLPVALSHLLQVDGAIVFKFFHQLIFAIVPLALYCIAKGFLDRSKAFIAAILFIGLPTFNIDMPFISRQEIAYAFVALALAAVFVAREPWLRRHRNALLVTASLGVVISHYSTAYLFIGPLVLAFIGAKIITQLRSNKVDKKLKHTPRMRLATWAIIIICSFTYIWLAQITKASDDLTHKLSRSISSVTKLVAHPELLLKSLGSPSGDSPQDSLRAYLDKTVPDPATNKEAILKNLTFVSSDDPPTSLSQWIKTHTRFDLADTTKSLYYGLATKLYLVFIAIGTIQLLRPSIRKKLNRMPVLYPIWCITAGGALVAQLLLPALAENYGITRAFMQAFMILVIPMLIGIGVVARGHKRLHNGLLISLATGLLLLYSGLIPYLTGGLHRQLSLQNSGQYYGTVYPQATDLAAYHWIETALPAGTKINIADYAAVYAYYPLSPHDTTNAGVFPFQIESDTYALLSKSQTTDHVMYTFDNLTGLSINPSMYKGSDLIYSNGTTQLFRKR